MGEEEIKGAGRPVYEGDIYLIFASPFLVSAQQSHFHKVGIKQLVGTLVYLNYQWLSGGKKSHCNGVEVSFFLCRVISDSMLLEGIP